MLIFRYTEATDVCSTFRKRKGFHESAELLIAGGVASAQLLPVEHNSPACQLVFAGRPRPHPAQGIDPSRQPLVDFRWLPISVPAMAVCLSTVAFLAAAYWLHVNQYKRTVDALELVDKSASISASLPHTPERLLQQCNILLCLCFPSFLAIVPFDVLVPCRMPALLISHRAQILQRRMQTAAVVEGRSGNDLVHRLALFAHLRTCRLPALGRAHKLSIGGVPQQFPLATHG